MSDRSGQPQMRLRITALACAGLLLLGGGLLVPLGIGATAQRSGLSSTGSRGNAAGGSSVFVTGFTDPSLTASNPYASPFARAERVDAEWVRLMVTWASIAPATPPAGFNASNPDSPGYDWTSLDESVRLATAHHLHVLLSFEDAPAWAEGANLPASAHPGTWRPKPSAVAAFAKALATRYSGRFPDPLDTTKTLPKVSHYQVWNEPNLSYHLSPQWTSTAKGYAPASPGIYRGILNAAYAAIKHVQPNAFVLSAGTAPYGDLPGRSRMAPVTFLEALLCLRGTKLKPAPCPDPAHLDGLDHHPYSSSPDTPAALADDVSVVDLTKLQRIVAAARRLHRVLPDGPKPFWITEIDWPSTPPMSRATDPYAVSLSVQAQYLSLAFYELWREHVTHVFWFLINDDREYGFGGSGVYFDDGRAKPAATAFRFPFVALDASAGAGEVKIWGRAPITGQVMIQRQIDRRWSTLATTSTESNGVFTGVIRTDAGGRFRARVGTNVSEPYSAR